MMLTTRGRYAVTAMAYLAKHAENNDSPVTLNEISETQNIPLNYLEQIFSKLKKANLVSSTKGPGGGYKVFKPLSEVTLVEIINAVEESIKITKCGNKVESSCMPNNVKCMTHNLWEQLGSQIENFFASITLEDFNNGKFTDAK